MPKKWIIIILVVLATILLTCVGGFVFFALGLQNAIEAHTGPWPVSLREARDDHATVLLKSKPFDEKMLPMITHPKLEYTSYEGPLGRMGAIATKVTYGQKKPAIIWDFGGFGGIFDGYADEHPAYDDQGVRQFLDQDLVVFLPTVRGEHGNPGVFECFYGEVEDLVAAVEHVASRPDVDPDRIFLMGHSTGGTNVLLASMLTDIPAGVVSFGGAPDMSSIVLLRGGYGVEPYDTDSMLEIELRSANRFTKYIQCPVLYIEGDAEYTTPAETMARKALGFRVPMETVVIEGGDHWTVLQPIKQMLAERIAAGKRDFPTEGEIQATFTNARRP